MTPSDLEAQRRFLLGLDCPVCDRGVLGPNVPCTCFDLDPFGDAWNEDEQEELRSIEERLFPLLDPEDNPSPFPDAVWAEFVDDHNREQLLLRRLYALLMGDL
jgi:hypothetical protein